MPNPVDFVGVAKFTELAGGMEVNNLQAAIRKALKEITLPDVSDVPTGSTGKTSDLPTLAPPTAVAGNARPDAQQRGPHAGHQGRHCLH